MASQLAAPIHAALLKLSSRIQKKMAGNYVNPEIKKNMKDTLQYVFDTYAGRTYDRNEIRTFCRVVVVEMKHLHIENGCDFRCCVDVFK